MQAGDVVKLVGGATVAQALAVVVSPIVSRLFGPEAFGVYAVFNTLVGMISVIVCLRYELAIALPKSDEKAGHLLWLSILIVVIISLLSLLSIVLFQSRIEELLDAPGLGSLLLLVPLGIFFTGLFQALNYWNTRGRQFGRLSLAQVLRSITLVGIQLGAGIAGFVGGGGLIAAAVVSQAAAAMLLAVLIWREDRRLLISAANFRGVLGEMRRYRNFPLIDSWSALFNSMSWNLPVFLLAAFFSSAVVGAYSFALTVVLMPVSLIGTAFSNVFFPAAAAARNEGPGEIARIVEESVVRLTAIGALPFLVLLFIGPEIFMVVFGGRWDLAGFYAQLLAPWILLNFISTPISSLFSVLERQRDALLLNVAVMPCRIGAIVAGGLIGNAEISVLLFSIVGVGFVGGSIIWLIRNGGASLHVIVCGLWDYAPAGLGVIAVVLVSKFALAAFPPLVVLVSGLSMVPFYLIVARKDEFIRAPFSQALRRLHLPVPRSLES